MFKNKHYLIKTNTSKNLKKAANYNAAKIAVIIIINLK